MNKLKRFFPRASENRMLARFLAPRPPACFLLGKGLRVSNPRCGACGKDLDLPTHEGETFLLAAPMAESRTDTQTNGASTWLFFGTKVLVAAVSSRLAPMLDTSVTFLGEKVLVAMAITQSETREPLLLCKDCGTSVLEKVNPPSQPLYGWDWLAELKPRAGKTASESAGIPHK